MSRVVIRGVCAPVFLFTFFLQYLYTYFCFSSSGGGGDLLKNIYVFFRPTWRAQAAGKAHRSRSAIPSRAGHRKKKKNRATVHLYVYPRINTCCYFIFFIFYFLYHLFGFFLYYFLLLYISDYNIPGLCQIFWKLSTGLCAVRYYYIRTASVALLHKQ